LAELTGPESEKRKHRHRRKHVSCLPFRSVLLGEVLRRTAGTCSSATFLFPMGSVCDAFLKRRRVRSDRLLAFYGRAIAITIPNKRQIGSIIRQ
jgi:hypothetical protein